MHSNTIPELAENFNGNGSGNMYSVKGNWINTVFLDDPDPPPKNCIGNCRGKTAVVPGLDTVIVNPNIAAMSIKSCSV